MITALASPLLDRLRAIVGSEGMLTAKCELIVYECDGFTIEKNQPEVVVFPTSTEQIVADRQSCATNSMCRLCRAGREPAWRAAACRSAAA